MFGFLGQSYAEGDACLERLRDGWKELERALSGRPFVYQRYEGLIFEARAAYSDALRYRGTREEKTSSGASLWEKSTPAKFHEKACGVYNIYFPRLERAYLDVTAAPEPVSPERLASVYAHCHKTYPRGTEAQIIGCVKRILGRYLPPPSGFKAPAIPPKPAVNEELQELFALRGGRGGEEEEAIREKKEENGWWEATKVAMFGPVLGLKDPYKTLVETPTGWWWGQYERTDPSTKALLAPVTGVAAPIAAWMTKEEPKSASEKEIEKAADPRVRDIFYEYKANVVGSGDPAGALTTPGADREASWFKADEIGELVATFFKGATAIKKAQIEAELMRRQRQGQPIQAPAVITHTVKEKAATRWGTIALVGLGIVGVGLLAYAAARPRRAAAPVVTAAPALPAP